ncbi:MAG TPA: hypothetical protein VLS27_00065 [Gammaproteobacteria bacterium]|nr:hypothetical protein [Gammaproteobacteria bacterium]
MSGAARKPGYPSELDRVLTGVRRRWRLRQIAEGTALALAATLVAAVAAVAVMDAWLFEPDAVSRARVTFYLIAGVALLLILRPAISRLRDDEMALYVETHAPHLDALMLSAVEARALLHDNVRSRGETSPELARRLVDRAAREGETSPAVSKLEFRRTRRASIVAAVILAVAAALVSLGPDSWRYGARLLFSPPTDPQSSNPYMLHVAPGNATLLSGEDLRISATPDGFDPSQVTLHYRSEGKTDWTQVPLAPAAETGEFETFLFDVSAALDYRVTHESLQSPVFRIDVVSRPIAERIDLLYEFPEYTGRAPELVTDGGDIAAVRGTRVEVRVTPSEATSRGRLVLDGDRFVDMIAEENGELRAILEVQDDGRYRVELEAGSYGMAPASAEHAIVANVDTLPKVTLMSPGRDVRVTSIEEIAVDVRAEDDVAVRELEIVLSVNGGPDEIVDLSDASGPQPTIEGRLELLLEERDLAPGDLIAYHVRARDAAGDPARQFTSDIFFMDVRPFEMSYRPSGGGGGGGGRAGGQQEETLSAQQRTLVIAMFKLMRDRATMEQDVFEERVATLNAAQERIRSRVEAIVRRLGARSIVELNPGYRRMAEELPKAAKSMLEVEALLALVDVQGALPAARFALLHLQRADSAFREVQVAQARQRGSGSAASDLENLFRLEMDRFRNQYEDIRRGDWRPRDRQLDDTLRKLRELAERQQRELERAQLRARRGGGGSDSQRALAEEVERLMRELERLTRRKSSEELRASMKALENAARAMRRSADAGDAAAGAEALDRLREANRLLDSEGPARLARDTEKALRRAERMADRQNEIENDVADGFRRGDNASTESIDLPERKQALADEVREMESSLDRLAERAGREQQPGAARALKEAAGGLREEKIAERIRRSTTSIAGVPAAEQREEEGNITRALRVLRARIASASRQIGEPDGTRLTRMLDQLRGDMRGLERDQERLAERARRGPALPGRGSRADVQPADLADYRRALEQRAGGIGGLAEALAAEPGLEGDLAALLSALEGARRKEDLDAESLERRHAELLAALKNIERELRARLEKTPPTSPAVARTEPPRSHREIVERYYRNLSEKSSP